MGLLDTEVAKWKRAFGLLGGIPKTFKNNPRNAETMDAVFGFGGIIPGIGDAVSAAEAKYRYDQGDMLGAGLAGLGALPMVPALAGTFIGKKGINNLGLADVLKQAEAMEKAGKSRDEIWEATAQMAAKKGVPGGGIGRGVDKQWRFELDDSGSQIELNGGRLGFEPSPQRVQTEHATSGPQKRNVRTSLAADYTTPTPNEGVTRSTRHNASFQGLEPPTSNLASGHNTPKGIVTGTHLFSNPQQWIDHYYLDKAYPELMYGKNAPNVRVDTINPGDSAYFPKMNYIVIRDEIPRHLKSKTLHELGHGIQRIEGHATGGNPATMPPNLGMTPEQVYWNQAGEAEARLTQSRMNMTPLDRQMFPPWSQKELGGYDVPESQQIVRFGDGPAMAINPSEYGLPVNPDGTVSLLHGTTKDAANKIIGENRLRSAGEPSVYLTNANNAGYGDGTLVQVDVDPRKLFLDDEFPGGRFDFSMPVRGGVANVKNARMYGDGPAMSVAVPDEWYHGSPWDIYKTKEGWFRPTEGEAGVPVVWGTKNMLSAEDYARGESSFIPDAFGKMPLTKSWYKDYDGNGGVYALESKAKKPFEYDAGGKDWFNVQQGKIIREAKEKGHDAVIFKNIKDNLQSGGPADDVIAWIDPNAIYNVGKPARPRNHLGQVIPPTPYELAHAEAQRVAALPVEQGGLGLPPDNTAMDRARAMGFDTPAYRGVRNEVRTANEPGTYSTNLPDAANIYANSEPGANVMPVLIKNNAPYIAESYSDIGIFDAQKLRGLTDSGYDSAMYKQPNGANEYIEYISPVSGIRSRFAAFNPAKRDSADLLAGLAPWALPVGATLLGGSFLLPPEEY